SVLQAFIAKYPSSFYVELAKAKIEELKQKQQDAERESMVRSVQRALKDTDCYEGTIDGIWSRSSQEALARFARLAKLDPPPTEPVQTTLDTLNGWKGGHCAIQKAALPRHEKAASIKRERPPATPPESAHSKRSVHIQPAPRHMETKEEAAQRKKA